VGNDMRLLVSEMAGRATIELKGRELGYDLTDDPERLARLTDRVKAMEQQGYTFEAADASFELLLAEELGTRHSYFDIESWRVLAESTPAVTDGANSGAVSEATVKLRAGGQRLAVIGEGNGPDAVTRVLIETTDGKNSWVTVGVGANIIEASWEALLDALTYGLRLHDVPPHGA
jgi:2-isopropylmalate synthase